MVAHTGTASHLPDTLLSACIEPPPALALARPPGRVRDQVDDFQVDEVLGWSPSGDGEHLLLHVEKRDMSTLHAARVLARSLGLRPADVGYAGLKDRHALTRQWFSVLARQVGDELPMHEGLRVLQTHRHHRKLRRGALSGNRFRILVRCADAAGRADLLAAGVAVVRSHGVPSYFGPQRFGIDGGNLDKAHAIFAGRAARMSRTLRGLLLSAARSALFNAVLARRVLDGSWCRLLPGELAMLDASGSFFEVDPEDPELGARLAGFDIHPSGPMWGRGRTLVGGEVEALECEVLHGTDELRDGLERVGLKQERRALRMGVPSLSLLAEPGHGWWLEFELPRGCYATSVLRELFVLEQPGPGDRA